MVSRSEAAGILLALRACVPGYMARQEVRPHHRRYSLRDRTNAAPRPTSRLHRRRMLNFVSLVVLAPFYTAVDELLTQPIEEFWLQSVLLHTLYDSCMLSVPACYCRLHSSSFSSAFCSSTVAGQLIYSNTAARFQSSKLD